MTHLSLFLGFSLVATIALILTSWYKKMDFKTLVGLFLFGVLMSIPFIIVEYLGIHLKFYLVILTFIAIELALLYSESSIKYFHNLIHHNIKELRFVSFFLIGLGFTFSEKRLLLRGQGLADLVAELVEELLKLEDKNVKVSGFIAEDEGGKKTITVTRYLLQE